MTLPSRLSSHGSLPHGFDRRDFLRATACCALGTSAAAFADTQPSTPSLKPMHKRPILSSGERLPVVGCGTWRTFDVGDDEARRRELTEVLRVLFTASGSVIDSSPMYGSSEAVAGALLAQMDARAGLRRDQGLDGRPRCRHRADERLDALLQSGQRQSTYRPDANSQPARLAHATRDAARLEGGQPRALPRRHALHVERLSTGRRCTRNRARGLCADQLRRQRS